MSDDRPDTSPTADLGLQLAQLADLHGQGVLSDEEFSAAKQRIINEKPTQRTAEPPAPKPTPGPFDETGHRIVTEKPDAKTRWKAEIDAKNGKTANKKTANKKTANMRFTKAALGVAVIGLLTFGFLPGQVGIDLDADGYGFVGERRFSGFDDSDCKPVLIALIAGRGDPDQYYDAIARVNYEIDNFVLPPGWAEGLPSSPGGGETTSEMAARLQRRSELKEPLYAELDDLRDARDTEVAYLLCGGSARSLLITAGLIATGFVAAAAAVEYVLKDRKNSDD